MKKTQIQVTAIILMLLVLASSSVVLYNWTINYSEELQTKSIQNPKTFGKGIEVLGLEMKDNVLQVIIKNPVNGYKKIDKVLLNNENCTLLGTNVITSFSISTIPIECSKMEDINNVEIFTKYNIVKSSNSISEIPGNYSNCTGPDSTIIEHLSSKDYYIAETDQYCIKQTRTCNNGVLSGTYTATNCSIPSWFSQSCIPTENLGLFGLWKLNDSSATIRDLSGNGNNGKLYGNTRLLLNFDDSTANDKTSYGNNGTVNGASWNDGSIEGDCISGGCYEFDGVDDWINFSTDTNFNFAYEDFSLNVWVKANNYSSDNWGDSIISKLNIINPRTGFDLRFTGELFPSASNQIYFWMGLNHSNGYTIIGPIINDSIWRNVIITVNRRGFMKLFIDGNLYVQSDISNFTNINNSNTKHFFIGKNDYVSDSVFNGSIDEVAIYSKALSDEEVLDLYNSQKAEFIEFKNSPLDKSVEFDGVDDYINSNIKNFNFNGSETYEINMLLKTNSNNCNPCRIIRPLDGKGLHLFQTGNDLKVQLVNSTYGLSSVLTYSNFPDGNLKDIFLSYSIGNLSFYVNGNLINSTYFKYDLASESNFGIGSTGGIMEFFNGTIEEITILNQSLNETKINEIYQFHMQNKTFCD